MLRLTRGFRSKAIGRTRIAPKSQSSLDPFKRPAFQRFEDLPVEQQEAAKNEVLKEFESRVDKNPEVEIPSEYSLIAAIKKDARRNRLNRQEIRDNILHFFGLTMEARQAQMDKPETATIIQRGRDDERSLLFDALEVLPKNHADIFSPEEYVAFFNLAKLGVVKDQARDMKTVCDLFYPLGKFRVDPYNEMEYLQLLLDSDQAQRALRYQQARLNHTSQDVAELRWYYEFGVVLLLSLGRIKDANNEADRIIGKFGWLESNLLLHLCKTATDSETMEKWTDQLLQQMNNTKATITRDPVVSLGNLTFTNIITKPGGVQRPFCDSEEALERYLSAKTVSVSHLTQLATQYISKGMNIKHLIREPGVKRILTDDTDVGLILATEASIVAKETLKPEAALKLFDSLIDQCPELLKVSAFYVHWLNVLTYFDKRKVAEVLQLMEENEIAFEPPHEVALATYYLKHNSSKALELLEKDTPAIWGSFLRHYARSQDSDKFESTLTQFLSKKRKPSPSTISAVVNYYHKQKNYPALWTKFNQVILNKYNPTDHLKTSAVFSSQLYRLIWKVLTDYYRASGDNAIKGKPSSVHSVAGSTPRADTTWEGEWVNDAERKWEVVNSQCAPAPRNLFLKMVSEQQVHSSSLSDVVPAFIRSGDFVGALAVLRFYKEVVGYDLDGPEAAEISQVLARSKLKRPQNREFVRPIMDDHPLWMGLEVDLNMYIVSEETVEDVLRCFRQGKGFSQ